MARVSATTPDDGTGTRTIVTLGAVIAALYFGREIFIPLALAILLSFVLAPSVRRLHAIGLGRVFPVLLTTSVAFAVIAAIALVMASQVRDVAAGLPSYEDVVIRKVDTLKGFASDGALRGVEDVLRRVQHVADISAPKAAPPLTADEAASPRTPSAPTRSPAPIPVEIQQPEASPLATAATMLSPLLHPLAIGGVVLIFTVFILLQREDLRNRLIRLFGASDLQRTTEAINDGGKRLSRYLLTQLLLNAATGVLVGIAAGLIGVPNPVLWGILFGCMRFVPYLGPIIGGGLPCLFAAALTPGWTVALSIAGVILVIELLVGQVLEPLLYGRHTGLSPVAVVISATFWTVLWGPIGLLLSTPLTVCLVVVGRHVERLEFLDVLLGDRPPLTASETFYQRMLAGDPTEVSDQAREYLKAASLTDYYDDVVLPGLLLAQGDVADDRLPIERQVQIRDATEEVLEDLEDLDKPDDKAGFTRWRHMLARSDANARLRPEDEDVATSPPWQTAGAVLCIGGRGPLDDCAAEMLAQILRHRGLGARTESFVALSKSAIDALDVSSTRLICLSCLDGSSPAYLRFALRRLHRHAPAAKILIGAWWLQTRPMGDRDQLETPGLTEAHATTVIDAARFCLAAASALTGDDLSPPEAGQQGLSIAS